MPFDLTGMNSGTLVSQDMGYEPRAGRYLITDARVRHAALDVVLVPRADVERALAPVSAILAEAEDVDPKALQSHGSLAQILAACDGLMDACDELTPARGQIARPAGSWSPNRTVLRRSRHRRHRGLLA